MAIRQVPGAFFHLLAKINDYTGDILIERIIHGLLSHETKCFLLTQPEIDEIFPILFNSMKEMDEMITKTDTKNISMSTSKSLPKQFGFTLNGSRATQKVLIFEAGLVVLLYVHAIRGCDPFEKKRHLEFITDFETFRSTLLESDRTLFESIDENEKKLLIYFANFLKLTFPLFATINRKKGHLMDLVTRITEGLANYEQHRKRKDPELLKYSTGLYSLGKGQTPAASRRERIYEMEAMIYTTPSPSPSLSPFTSPNKPSNPNSSVALSPSEINRKLSAHSSGGHYLIPLPPSPIPPTPTSISPIRPPMRTAPLPPLSQTLFSDSPSSSPSSGKSLGSTSSPSTPPTPPTPPPIQPVLSIPEYDLIPDFSSLELGKDLDLDSYLEGDLLSESDLINFSSLTISNHSSTPRSPSIPCTPRFTPLSFQEEVKKQTISSTSVITSGSSVVSLDCLYCGRPFSIMSGGRERERENPVGSSGLVCGCDLELISFLGDSELFPYLPENIYQTEIGEREGVKIEGGDLGLGGGGGGGGGWSGDDDWLRDLIQEWSINEKN